MEYSLEFKISALYRKPSPIGLFEGLVYYNKFGKESVYYPKNKEVLRVENINKTFTIKIDGDGLIESLSN